MLTRAFFPGRQRFVWRVGARQIALGERTLVMGILNVTPDSFSDGGKFLNAEKAVRHGLEMLADGADILDIGGESTRPGSEPVDTVEELARVLPVMRELLRGRPDALLSIDTSKAAVARAALQAGAAIVNDVSGLAWDAAMARTCAELDCGVVLMHTHGRPSEWKSNSPIEPGKVTRTIVEGLRKSLAVAGDAGIDASRIALDPGFGFGKRGISNYELLGDFAALQVLQRPLLAGVSRKSFLSDSVREAWQRNGDVKAPRGGSGLISATGAASTAAILAGAHMVRVHDVAAAVEGAAVADAILRATPVQVAAAS